MDIAGAWRRLRTEPGALPTPGAQVQTAGDGITITVSQQCQVALPLPNYTPDEVTVTVTSQRPGVAAQVSVGANLNSPDGSYQGPTTTVGQGQFTATSSQIEIGFVVLPAAGWPVLGVGAEATWADGAQPGVALTYASLACDPLVWWQWVFRVIAVIARPFTPQPSRFQRPSA